MGEYEWRMILRYLTSGQNLHDAVANANAAVADPTLNWYAIQPDGTKKKVPPQEWQVVGDSGKGGVGIHF